jgi:hypothetical protein
MSAAPGQLAANCRPLARFLADRLALSGYRVGIGACRTPRMLKQQTVAHPAKPVGDTVGAGLPELAACPAVSPALDGPAADRLDTGADLDAGGLRQRRGRRRCAATQRASRRAVRADAHDRLSTANSPLRMQWDLDTIAPRTLSYVHTAYNG